MKKRTKGLLILAAAIQGIADTVCFIVLIIVSLLNLFMAYCGIMQYEYTDNITVDDGYVYHFNNYRREYAFSVEDDNIFSGTEKTIDVPDSYNGHKVTVLATIWPASKETGFCYVFPFDAEMDFKSRADINSIPNDSEIVNYTLTVNLGKNVKKIYADFYDPECYFKIKDENKYGNFMVYFNCPEDNKYFYSVDGVLYNKSDDTPVIEYFS